MALDDLSEKVVFEYIELFLQGINYETIITGSAQPQITQQSLLKLYIAIPPLAEQHRIIEKVNKHADIFTELTIARQRYKHILSETPTSLRQQLIQTAIQGQLVPQNPNDEPASVLLERIAKERTQKIGKKATKSTSRIERRGSKTYELFPDSTEKDISDEIPFEIPDSWEWARLERIVDAVTGKTPSKGEPLNYNTNDVPFYKPADINESEVTTARAAEFVSERGAKCAPWLPSGSILVNCIGNIGKCSMIQNPGICNQQINAILPNSSINMLWLLFLLKSSFMIGQEIAHSSATTISILNKTSFLGLLVPVPPRHEQERIAFSLQAYLRYVSL